MEKTEVNIIDNLKRFGIEFQTKCIASLLADRAFLERMLDILKPNYFEADSQKWIVEQIMDYFIQYKDIPTLTVFKIKSDLISDVILKKSVIDQLRMVYQKISDSDINYVRETFLEFCRNQSLKNAMLVGVDYLKTGEYEKIRYEIDKALKAGAERNLGHNYFEDVDRRLSDIARFCVKTGWQLVDSLLDGGLSAGELGVIISSAGGGKSWVLARLGAEAMLQGRNVLHFTLELNENYVGRRYDACFTGFDFQVIPKEKETVKSRVTDMRNQPGMGKLRVKYYPIKTVSAMSLKSFLERCQTLDGIKYDLMIVDYADILRPITSERNSNSYSEAGSIYEELRMIAGELQIPVWTASQGNRGSSEEDIITASDVADSYRKIMTADFVMSLSRKIEDKVSNTARFHVIKNRFGCDGITFPSIFNSSNGSITLYDQSSKEGLEIQEKMEGGENTLKKMLSDKWQKHNQEDDNTDEV